MFYERSLSCPDTKKKKKKKLSKYFVCKKLRTNNRFCKVYCFLTSYLFTWTTTKEGNKIYYLHLYKIIIANLLSDVIYQI